jgi:two-component system sensor kinase FixL
MSTSRSPVSDALLMLELNEARWQAVLHTARDAIISIDVEGKVSLFNRAAEAIFGYAADEVLGRNVSILMSPPYRDEHDGYILRYRQTGVPKAIGRIRQIEARRKNGEVFPIELAVSEARVGDDVIYTAIIRDISDRLQAQAKMHELQRLAHERERLADIGAITAKIVHDLGNPLAGLSMQAQLLLRRLRKSGAEPTDPQLETAERILGTIRHLETLIGEFMAFAREQRLEVRHVELAQLLQEVLELWQPVAEARGIQLRLECPADVPLEADAPQLKRVIDNLVKNGIEAIDKGPGRVRIAVTAASPETVRITVEDDGPGFPPSIECFRLFQTTKPRGTGLGLAVVRQIVLAHAGQIHLEAAEPRGTVFHVDLPKDGPAAGRGDAAGV